MQAYYDVIANFMFIVQQNTSSKLVEHKCLTEHSLRNAALNNYFYEYFGAK